MHLPAQSRSNYSEGIPKTCTASQCCTASSTGNGKRHCLQGESLYKNRAESLRSAHHHCSVIGLKAAVRSLDEEKGYSGNKRSDLKRTAARRLVSGWSDNKRNSTGQGIWRQFLRQWGHVLHRRFGSVFFPTARRSGRPWRTMFTAGVAVCHCRVRMGSENVTTSDDVLWDDWVGRERTEHGAICAFGLNSPGLIRLRFKWGGGGVGGEPLHKEQVAPQWHVSSGRRGQECIQPGVFLPACVAPLLEAVTAPTAACTSREQKAGAERISTGAN